MSTGTAVPLRIAAPGLVTNRRAQSPPALGDSALKPVTECLQPDPFQAFVRHRMLPPVPCRYIMMVYRPIESSVTGVHVACSEGGSHVPSG